MTFCTMPKLGLFCTTYKPTTEKRRTEDITVVRVTLQVEPLTVEIAAAIDPLVRRTLFRQQHPEPAPYMHEVTFALDPPRQQLHVFASTDSDRASILLDQVAIGRVRARRGKFAWALAFHATFGPPDAKQLLFVQQWFRSQRFVTFEPSEGDLFEEPREDLDDAIRETAETFGGEDEPAKLMVGRRRPRSTH